MPDCMHYGLLCLRRFLASVKADPGSASSSSLQNCVDLLRVMSIPEGDGQGQIDRSSFLISEASHSEEDDEENHSDEDDSEDDRCSTAGAAEDPRGNSRKRKQNVG